eukprot:766819-Hanusia_phi.AAC.3
MCPTGCGMRVRNMLSYGWTASGADAKRAGKLMAESLTFTKIEPLGIVCLICMKFRAGATGKRIAGSNSTSRDLSLVLSTESRV